MFELTHTEDTAQYVVCDECAVALENGDISHLDPEDDADMIARIEQFAESTQATLHTAEAYVFGGYWTCDACWSVNIGLTNVFEGARTDY